MIESRKKNGKPIRPKPRNRLVPRDDKEEREDFVLDESLQIMVDYIHLQRKQPLNQVVIRKQ